MFLQHSRTINTYVMFLLVLYIITDKILKKVRLKRWCCAQVFLGGGGEDASSRCIYLHFQIIITDYKGSAWVSAFAGTYVPGRAGQHFYLFDSMFRTIESKNRYRTTYII